MRPAADCKYWKETLYLQRHKMIMERKAIAKGTVRTSGKSIKVHLDIIRFEDSGSQIVYCPALDLSGYGKDDASAEESFKITLEEFFRYTINKNTLSKELLRLGWVIKKNSNKMTPPTMSELLSTNRQFKSIFNKRPFIKSATTVSIPAFN